MQSVINHFVDRVRAADRAHPLRLRGGGSKDFYGGLLQGDVLETSAYRGIVDYEPTELVITARCGTPLAEIETALAERGQMLAFEPPHFGVATVGGCVAAGLAGPRRAQAGAVRDFVLGIRLLDGNGVVQRFGGQVMKNVAGFDVSRLLAGSMGTLGVILEVSLKVLPRPARQATLRFAMNEAQALEALNRWAGQPLPISASAWQGGVLHLRLAGAAAAVDAACGKLGGERVADMQAEEFWQDVREQRAAFFAGDAPLWRLSLPSTAASLNAADAQLIEWGGSQRWLRSNEPVSRLRELAAHHGGHATLFRGASTAQRIAGVFHPLPPALLTLNRRVCEALDPRGAFATARLNPQSDS